MIGTQITIDEILTRAVDPCENRHKGSPQSVVAHERVLPSKDATYKRIMEVLTMKGPLTSKEIARALNVIGLNYISGRFSEMKALGWIEETGNTRQRAAELRAMKPMSAFTMVACPKCEGQIVAANMQRCYVCESSPEMCRTCLDGHVKTHSEVELDAALIAD